MHLQRGNAFLWMRLRVSQSWREGETCLMKQPLKHADLILADNPSSNPPGILLGCCMAHSEKSNPVPSKRWTETGRTATQTQKRFHFFWTPTQRQQFLTRTFLAKKKLQEGFISLKKKAGLYADYQAIPNGVLPPGPSLQPSHFENIWMCFCFFIK